MTHYDLIVIGSGPAGEKGAAQAAYFGKRVAIVEQAPEVGGTGINTGTIPSKTLRETALYFSGLHQRGLYGVDHRVAKDLTVNDFLYREREVVRSLGSLVLQNIERHHIDLVHGRASFEDPHTIRVQRGERQQDLPLPHALYVTLRSGVTMSVDCVLFAAGRAGNTTGLRLEKVGIPMNDRGLINVNERYQTLVSHIYAAGDVIGFPALAATSMEQARVAMVHAFDLKYKARVAPLFPLAVYSIPEVAMVGETEESCRRKSIDYCVGRAYYRQNARGQIAGDLNGL